MNTVADGLASLSFHHGKRKGEEKERKAVETEKRVKGRRQNSITAEYRVSK